MKNKSLYTARAFPLLAASLAAISIAGCSGNNANNEMAKSIKEYLNKTPISEKVRLTIPGMTSWGGAPIYDAAGKKLTGLFSVLSESSNKNKNEKAKLSGLVSIGWLKQKIITVIPRKQMFGESWLMTLDSDPAEKAKAQKAIGVVNAHASPITARIQSIAPQFFNSGISRPNWTPKVPNKLPNNFFLVTGPGWELYPKAKAAIKTLVDHGYLNEQSLTAWKAFSNAWVKKLSPKPKYMQRQTIHVYYMTTKGRKYLIRDRNYSADTSYPKIVLAIPKMKTPIVVTQSYDGYDLNAKGIVIPSPLYQLAAVRDWAMNSDVQNLLKIIGKSTSMSATFKTASLKDYSGNFAFNKLSTGAPQQLLIYKLTPKGHSMLGNDEVIPYGHWELDRITNYTKSTNQYFGGRMVDALFKFKTDLPAKTIHTISVLASKTGTMIDAGTTKPGQCGLVKMHKGWKTYGCQVGSS